ncbi:hypothetical protein H2204_003076 [Knufia peltigerae]|uniref:L-type lectin-like domain-containing protein n=1 Tax=Knufia peltigerae TaxID=1002370 RepID=A0AA38Y9X4_9EURO|nr:hypothetical protein H2204_003076 [Knufia peltigerae]
MLTLHATCLSLLWAVSTLAQNLDVRNPIEDLSFGHKSTLSPNSFAIPGWSMLGEGHVPQLLSDRVILTPPYGGNKRGALWSENKLSLQDWQVDLKFRAGATDRGSGNFQLWYAQDGDKQVSTSNIYSVGTWEGLAIVVDTVGGIQKIRGFLNDGSTDYKSHGNVDSLAFGHCDYTYRNLGRPSHIVVRSSGNGLQIEVDGRSCFATDKVSLPSNYNFGLTASSADPPDSFEVFAFAVSNAPATSIPQAQQHQHQQQEQSPPPPPAQNNPDAGMSQMDDHPASFYTTSEAQFADLHNRLNLLSKSITNLFTEITRHTQAEEARYREILSRMPTEQSMRSLESKFGNLDRVVGELERELKSSDHKAQFAKISEQISQTHLGVTEHVPQRLREYVQAHTPRIGFILYSFMAFQTCCIGAWAWYKYRKSTMPKKYL